ncbi:MAG TPA: hypothetical protein PK970_04600 [Hyphomicrobiaceae bacterium]|nr:hypothetical protein [Hyphomicrobiaceae bacterium]
MVAGRMKAFGFIVVAGVAVGLAGCESGGSSGGDPGARPLPPGATCQSLRAELSRMDAQGAQSKVERASRGKVDPATQAVADRYNGLLNQYLGARCHS